MKKLIYGTLFLAIVGIGFVACEKDEVIANNASESNQLIANNEKASQVGDEFKYSKELTVRDDSGNELDLVIFTNSKEDLDDHNSENFEIVLNNAEELQRNTIPNTTEFNVDEASDVTVETSVLVYIKNRRFVEEVTSFAVYPVFEEYSADRASSPNFRNYAYAADNIEGATATYTSDTQSKEYMELDIKKKNGNYGIWSTLLSSDLNSVGNSASYCGSQVYHTMMIKVKFHKIKTGVCCYGYSWSFVTSC